MKKSNWLILAAMIVLTGLSVRLLILPLKAADKKNLPMTKTIHGHASNAAGQSLAGAKVFVRNLKRNTTTVLVTDARGLYSVTGLDAKIDYEVHAEYGSWVSEKTIISAYLDRANNMVDFAIGESAPGKAAVAESMVVKPVTVSTSDGLTLEGDWYVPASRRGQVRLPALLLIHDASGDRSVWRSWVQDKGLGGQFVVLAIDLRGHGASPAGAGTGGEKINSRQYLVDVQAALDWLKLQEQVDPKRIGLMGVGLGANLAYVASGKDEAVCAAVALEPDAAHVDELAQGIDNFQPHSVLFLTSAANPRSAVSARELEAKTGFPVRTETFDKAHSTGVKMLEEIPEASDAVMQWLKNTL